MKKLDINIHNYVLYKEIGIHSNVFDKFHIFYLISLKTELKTWDWRNRLLNFYN